MKSFNSAKLFEARETRETHESKKIRRQQQEWFCQGDGIFHSQSIFASFRVFRGQKSHERLLAID